MIETAYREGEKMGLAVWVEDEAGPYQTVPYAGESWQPEGQPVHQPHEYIRNGTAKMLTMFHPASGEVRVKGVTQSTNAILHPWIQAQVAEILKTLPEKPILDEETTLPGVENLAAWFIGTDYTAGTTATVTDVVDLGQPPRSLHPRTGPVVVRTRHNGFIYPTVWFLVKYG